MEFCEGIKFTYGIDRLIVHCINHGPLGSIFYGPDENDEAQVLFSDHEMALRSAKWKERKKFYTGSGRPPNEGK